MELRDMRYFCLTAELEHVSKAAYKLGISQPFLTKVIGQLEKELGTQLFEQTGRHIRLNTFGELFYDRSKKILNDVDGLLNEMDEMLCKQDKTIKLLTDSGGYTSNIVLAYKKEFPNNMLSISYGKREGIIEDLNTAKSDFALCTPPITEDESKQIETIIVYKDCGCIFFPPEHPLIGKGTVSLEQLENEPLVTSPKGGGVRNNLELVFEKYGYVPNVVCESNDMDLLVKAVLGGLGFAFMPHRFMSDPQLRPYCAEIRLPGEGAEIGLSFNKKIAGSAKSEEFKHFISNFFVELKGIA
ncbi:MAG: LysR family transcriptional regulator [Oscillospiraceae bacterium]